MLEAVRKSRCLNSAKIGSWALNTQPRGILPHLFGEGSLGYSLAHNKAHHASDRSGRRWRNTCLTHLVQSGSKCFLKTRGFIYELCYGLSSSYIFFTWLQVRICSISLFID